MIRRLRRIAAPTLLLLAALALASAAFWPIHRDSQLVVAVGVALAAGTAVALAGTLLRWPSWAVGGATIGAFLLLGVPVAVPSEALFGVIPTVPGLAELVSGAALGWKELLTISLPVGSYQGLLVPAFLSVLVLTVVGLTVALRSPVGELAVVAPALLYLTGILFGPEGSFAPLVVGLGLLAVTLAFLVHRRARRHEAAILRLNAGTPLESRQERRRAGLRTALGAALVLAIAAGGATAATALAPVPAGRTVLRTAVEVPFDPREQASPLSAFRRWFAPERADATQLTVGLAGAERLRVATLDTYDGVVFTAGSGEVNSASGTFTRVPGAVDVTDEAGERVSIDVAVDGYTGVWVPSVGMLERLDFTGPGSAALDDAFYYNAVSGTAAVLPTLPTGARYTLDALATEPATDEQIAALRPGAAPVPELPVVPDELDAALDAYAGGTGAPGERLAAVIAGLRETGYISHGGEDEPFSRSGHSADRITELLTASPMLGDAEQYAPTAALMARRLGFPSRVVVGFTVGEGGVVRGADATAWIEVSAAGDGWVAIDPNPPIRPVPEPEPDEANSVSRPQSIVQPPPEEHIEQDDVTPPDVAEEEQEPAQPAWLAVLLALLRVLGITLLVLAIVAAPFLGIIGAKLARRRRRKAAATPLQRIAGGWAEFADAALDHGIEAPRTATRYEFAMAVGGRPPLLLAVAVDRATFAPVAPAAADAEEVWASVDELRRNFDAGRTRWERLRALLSLRSLRLPRPGAPRAEPHEDAPRVEPPRTGPPRAQPTAAEPLPAPPQAPPPQRPESPSPEPSSPEPPRSEGRP
ncbi:MAG: transglutaminase protein [Naasia sp.]|nr:transglutaminase protein [Naasia sp.]